MTRQETTTQETRNPFPIGGAAPEAVAVNVANVPFPQGDRLARGTRQILGVAGGVAYLGLALAVAARAATGGLGVAEFLGFAAASAAPGFAVLSAITGIGPRQFRERLRGNQRQEPVRGQGRVVDWGGPAVELATVAQAQTPAVATPNASQAQVGAAVSSAQALRLQGSQASARGPD